jgi:hypothetical protein
MLNEFFKNIVNFLTAVNIDGETNINNSLTVLSSLEVQPNNSHTTLYVTNSTVGINTQFPNVEFTVNGEISSNKVIYDEIGNSTMWNSGFTSVSQVSANWDSVYTSVKDTSANWNSVYTSVKDTSANWNSVYTSVKDTSANWNSVYTSVKDTSGNWDSVYSSVLNTSANWDSVYTSVLNTSANWDSVYSSVLNTSANWDSVYTSVLNTSGNWDSVYSSVLNTSANWDSVYSSVLNTSGNWDSVYSSVLNTSGNWDSVYTTYNKNSADYTKYDYVNNSFLPLSGGTVTGITQFNNNVTIWGVLSATGGTFFSNTIYSTTSAISVVHVGAGPALYVGSIGTGDVASFYDLDQNLEMLHIGGHDGDYPNVGIKTSTPNVDFTVNGEISSNNIIYDRDGNSTQWNSGFTSINKVSANWDSVYTTVKDTSGNWDSVYTSVLYTSANWDSVYTSVKDTSGNWNSVYTSVLNNSANWDSTFTSVKDTSANWDSVYSTVKNASATFTGSLTDTLTSDLNVGAITAGQVFDIGTTFQAFAEKLITKVFYPTFTLPSATLTSNLASIVESGTTGITLTVNLNKGLITGKSLNGIWQPTLFQNNRSGDATKYTILGVDNGTTTAYTSANAVIIDGTNTFLATVDYDTGPQPVDSKNNNFNSPLVSGSISPSLTITGRRRAFYGINNAGLNSDNIRNLQNSLLNPSNGSKFTINIPIGTTSVLFAYPASLRDVDYVEYVQGLGSDVKTNFTKTTFDVEGLNSYTGTQYKVYRYAPTGIGGVPIPFTQNVDYIVTI